MRIYLHIGLEHAGATRLQKVLAEKRDQLRGKGVLFPRAPGGSNHTRLYMAVTDPEHIDPLRFNRGFITPEKQQALRERLSQELAAECAQAAAHTLILSASQLASRLHRRSELERLKAFLSPLSDDIRIVAHLDEPARLLAKSYASQVFDGRAEPLAREVEMAGTADWWKPSLKTMPPIDPQAGQFEETQGAPFWLDFTALQARWEDVFGAGSVAFRAYDEAAFHSAEATAEVWDCFGLPGPAGRCAPASVPPQPSAAWVARARQFNSLLLQLLASRQRILPRQLWRSLLGDLEIAGDPIHPASLAPVSRHFADTNKALAKAHPALGKDIFKRVQPRKDWTEADPEMGFRASQYLLAFLHRIDKATREEMKSKGADLKTLNGTAAAAAEPDDDGTLSPGAQKILPPLAVQNFETLRNTPFAPHNRLGSVDETAPAAAYEPIAPRQLAQGSSGNVIVGCMKNEAPYIVEWVAYHRSIGFDNFLIYTNGCEDGTAEILDRLQEMGVLQHRNNDNWKGNSPQQHALNQSLKEPLIRNAEWIAHIDVDEFINVRCGNGTLQDFFARVPDATNVAMTWRLFGHNGITALKDRFVTGQFDACAPKYCPKPHTVWGFKTMFKNIGAYKKISCHRPNKLEEDFRAQVKWVNGSGVDMTSEAADNGWRNSRKSIGYDLLQLNHYALRSAESFLIKRQRGRALHVDRSIGINYWIRMDWCDHTDTTIQRNLPRLEAEYTRLMADKTLRKWHESGLEWHHAKARELHGKPEFEELYQQALEIDLTATERAAYALALDVES